MMLPEILESYRILGELDLDATRGSERRDLA
jgi:hypothetical protein